MKRLAGTVVCFLSTAYFIWAAVAVGTGQAQLTSAQQAVALGLIAFISLIYGFLYLISDDDEDSPL